MAIEDYLQSHPSTVIIDPVSSIRKITSRARACECLERVMRIPAADNCAQTQGEGGLFSLPVYCVAESADEFVRKIESHNLVFPVICKPVHACGTPESHLMVSVCP